MQVPDATGTPRQWHLLDNRAEPTLGTVLCVHGNPTWSYLWRRFIAAAPPGWRVVAPDQLGMGWSQRLPSPRGMAARIDDLDRLTAALGITGSDGGHDGGPIVLIAHDWGGPIGLGWAQRHAERLAGIVLANTGVALPGSEAPRLIKLARSAALRETVCVTTPTFVRGATAVSTPALPREIRDALASPYRTPRRRRAVADFVADIPLEPDHPSRTTLDAVADGLPALAGVPTLLLWGPKDPVFSETYLNDLLERFPHADVHRYARASHLVTEDAPETAEHAWRWISDQRERADHDRDHDQDHDQDRDVEVEVEAGAPFWSALTERAADAGVATVEISAEGSVVTSFAELEGRVVALAAGLRAAGVQPGDRVALLIRPGLDLLATVYACWRAGAVIVLADAGLGLRNLGNALRSADPDHVIAIPAGLVASAALRIPGQRIVAGVLPPALRRRLGVRWSLAELSANAGAPDSLPPPPSPDAEAAVLFTSGATGPSKGVVYRHGQLRAQLDLVRAVMRIGREDRLVAAFAPFALYGPAMGIAAAVPDMDVTKPATLTAAKLVEAVRAVQATVVFASPAALRNVDATAAALTAEQRAVLAGVRTVLSAGAPVPLPLLRRVQAVLPNAELHTPYGMTEALPVTDVSLAQIEEAGPGDGVCVGWAVPGVQIRISPLDPTGAASGEHTDDTGVTGEICVAGPHVKDRYDRLWATERQSSREPGWHRTGDVGHLDDAGRLWVEGRLVHVITAPDDPLTPVGIEQRVEALEAVVAAAAVGVGPAGTQQLVLVVVPEAPGRGPLAEPDLAASVREAAGGPVAAVLTVRALPVDIRHASKVDRSRLGRWAERVLGGGRVARP